MFMMAPWLVMYVALSYVDTLTTYIQHIPQQSFSISMGPDGEHVVPSIDGGGCSMPKSL